MNQNKQNLRKPILVTSSLLTLLLFVGTISAATGVGTYSANFLQINSGARQVAMGEAYTALAYKDINLMRYNIGGLGSIRNIMLAINYHDWIQDTHQGAFSLALPTRMGVIGFDFNYFNEGELTELDENFLPTGSILKSNDIALTLGYGSYFKLLNQNFMFGGGFKFIQQNLGNESASALGLDVGLLLWLKHLALGVTMQNFSVTKLKFINHKESLPTTYRAGIGGHFRFNEYIRWNIDFDAAYIPDQDPRFYSGTELIINDLFMIRGGYKFHDFDANRWSAGLGLLIPMNWLASSETRLDYAFSPFNNFEGSTHRFSLLFRFGVPIPGKALNVPDERKLEALNQQLQTEIDKAKKARIEAEESFERTKAMEDTLRARLERVKKIISESEGKIELVEATALEDTVTVMEKVHLSMRINFDFGKATIRPEDYSTMNQIGEILNTYPDSKVFISGHTDYIGSHDYNYELSKKRIDNVMYFLTERENVNQIRFFNPMGYGKLKPIADNTTEEGRFRNRRVEFLIYTSDREPDLPDASGIKAVQLIDNSTIHIVGNGKLTYEDKFLTDPYRLVIDFPRTLLLTEQRKFDLFRDPVIRARLGFHPDDVYTRAVIDLLEAVQYEIETNENKLIIHLK